MAETIRPETDGTRRGIVETPLGRVGLCWRGRVVIRVELDPETELPGDRDRDRALQPNRYPFTGSDSRANGGPVPRWLVRQIQAYCQRPDFRFSLQTAPAGTAFQHRVWRLIASIPSGCTRTYSALARDLESSPRAVGGACRANPYPLLVPCHRVVAVDGLGGFAGDTRGTLLAFKRRLLLHEGVQAAA